MGITKCLAIGAALLSVNSFAASVPTHKTEAEDFFYAQQTSLWVFFKAPKQVIRQQLGETLDRLGFELASFENENLGYIIIKPMVFMAEFGFQDAVIPGTSASTEVELTVLVQPKKNANKQIGTFDDFLSGRMKNSSIGQLRLDVLCDHEIAVAAGRKNFGEHKFLGSFTYNYTSPNNQVGATSPFNLEMTAYTWQGAGQADKKMFQIRAQLKGLKPTGTQFSPELLYSSFPPEPEAGVAQKAVGEFRHYNNSNFKAYSTSLDDHAVEISFGDAKGAVPLKPVPPFGDGKAINGSEKWPQDMVGRMRALLTPEGAVGFLLFRSPSAEYETRPFEL